MASKEKIKKKLKSPSPAFGRKRKSIQEEKDKLKAQLKKKEEEKRDAEKAVEESIQGSQVSVRSAADENIHDLTRQDPDAGSHDELYSPPMSPQQSALSPRQSNAQGGKKSKADHIDSRLGESSMSPQKPGPSSQTPQAAGKVQIPGPAVMGSAVSLQSNFSRTSREAWVEKAEMDESQAVTGKVKGSGPFGLSLSRDNKVAPGDPTRSNTRRSSDVLSLRDGKHGSKETGLKGIKVDVVEEDSPEKHAYIPYLYARNCIAKIMEDMKSMKKSHIVIVENIQVHYNTIETETQEQFNMFVLCMRDEYSNKRMAFRKCIDAHRAEQEKKEKYWNEMLESLAERNNRLLKEKKMLLISNKTEIEKLMKDKDSMAKDYTEQLERKSVAMSMTDVGDTEQSSSTEAASKTGKKPSTVAKPKTTGKGTTKTPKKAGTVAKSESSDNHIETSDMATAYTPQPGFNETSDLATSYTPQPGYEPHDVGTSITPAPPVVIETRETCCSPIAELDVPVVAGWEEEKKVLLDQLETEKSENARLQEHLANHPQLQEVPVVEGKTETASVERKEAAAAGAGALVAAGALAVTKENNKQMEKERKDMEDERHRQSEERARYEGEMEGFAEEKKKWLEEIYLLQTKLAGNTKEGSEWKTKHDVLKDRLVEAGDMQAKYRALESQYAALALLVKNTDTSTVIQEQMQQTQQERAMLEEEKTNKEKEIKEWEKTFEKENARKPTEADKSDMVKEMYTTLGELEYVVTSLERKEETFKQVENGTVPEAPEISTKTVDTTEPEVVTVQVNVPDPTVVRDLEKSQEEITSVKTEVTTLTQEVSDLHSQISKLNEELATERNTIAELESQIASLKAGGAVAMANATLGEGASNEELEALKAENRELRKDMKKMIKQYQRLAERQGGESGDSSEQMEEMGEALKVLDDKVADLETENEALREERVILREKVRTITETITTTYIEDNRKSVEERDSKIESLMQELEKVRGANAEMQKDMKKMVKTHAKTKLRLNELVDAEKAVQLLEVVAMLVHQIHGEVPGAGTKVGQHLADAEESTDQSKRMLDHKQAMYEEWLDQFQNANGRPAGKEDRDKAGQKAHTEWEIAKRDYKEKHLIMSALKLIKTGDISKAVEKDDTLAKSEIEIAHLEKALSAADDKIIDMESRHKTTVEERNRYKEKSQELEETVAELQKQVDLNKTLLADSESSAELTEQIGDLQKKSDSFESELMQERMSHMNTRDELETLRKQMEVMKGELENERRGIEARMEGVKASFEAQLQQKDQEKKSLETETEALQAEKLAKLPPDAAKQVKELQDKLKDVEKEKSSNTKSSTAMTGQLAELTSKLDVANKNLENQRTANRDLEAKLRSNRQEREKDSKRVSRHMEEKQVKAASEDKQRIAMLVKRVKELEAQLARAPTLAPVPVAAGKGGGKTSDGEVHMLRRQIKDQEANIKQLEKEVRLGGGTMAAGGAGDKKGSKHEAILKQLEKRLEHEKEKSEKLLEGLKGADDENKALKKALEGQEKTLTKAQAELKTISLAAKEGVEAASKVKELKMENKRMGEENITLTKNFESERVLRKKYYNMVEDMKGKIRVYCRARPMSKSELDRGNKSVLTSADEYTVSVEATRGLKEFQYDQVFMEDSSQEKIFEDTNNLIQSAMDGYNVCIFAYGQTGSGKTFTMIGDREQKMPGIAPRAFSRIFEMADEMKSKFMVKVEAYMLELYNERLIDLFAKPAGDEDKLEIKKDKKGMVYVQGSMVKPARNSKELFALFEEGSTNRHTASTKMNAESSRSHLVIGIILECTNKNTGNITKGKLSLVDLAGSERVGKTGAGAEQLREAMSINKSLSALGDVISALSSEQQFIPYRNNKLTMLMQDSLGGNAKTLMFVNISPADYNMDETVISLTYASRVKLITNDASKNADNKEINRLKSIIAKLKKGDAIEEGEDEA